MVAHSPRSAGPAGQGCLDRRTAPVRPARSLTRVRDMTTPTRSQGATAAQADGQVEVVRRFNRSYTQRVGALDESFLGTGMPLGTARLLFEIGTEPGTTRDLRARLGLDSGYLSRLLRPLESDGLVSV